MREPTLRDVYVEGNEDVRIISAYLRRCGSDAVVYSIDTVQITAEQLSGVGLDDGRRGRVIYLALQLDQSDLAPPLAVTCLCDADRDLVLGTSWDLWPLIMTDGTTMDMYLWTEGAVDAFLAQACKDVKLTGAELLAQLSADAGA